MRSKLPFGAGLLFAGTFLTGTASAECPGFGQDTTCGAIITITQTGATVAPAGQPAYDGSDDTLVGVVNNIPPCTPGAPPSKTACGLSIYSLDLSSTTNICGFDGDGIDTYGATGNLLDPTGYGGPNAFFTDISADQTSCRVNFMHPIAPGQTDYFSLENVLTAPAACTDALNNSVPPAKVTNGSCSNPPASPGTTICNTFTPSGGSTIAQAALACNFTTFNWQQTITVIPDPRPDNLLTAADSGATLGPGLGDPKFAVAVPTNDPPAAGWNYQKLQAAGPNPVQIPVYYNLFIAAPNQYSLASHMTATNLFFGDKAADVCLPGTQSASTAALADSICGGPGVRAAAGSTINFTTELVGIQMRPVPFLPSVVHTGIGFSWTDSFNGTVGMISVLNTPDNVDVDPGSGTGGITVTGYTPTPTYIGVAISGVNGSSNVPGPTSLLAAVLPESRSAQVNGTVTAFATIINTGAPTASSCSIAPASTLPATFVYQTTNPTTNAVTGTANTPVDIAGNNGSQSFVIAFTPNAAFAPMDVGFNFSCTNTSPAPINTGLNTLLLSASTTPTPDVIALAATLQNDGIVHATGAGNSGVFAVATDNLGSADTITVGANTGDATLPLSITMCQTNPTTGACMQTPAAAVTTAISTNATPTFGIFVNTTGTIPFDPANSRIFVTFTDSTKAIRGETSVAVETQ